MVIGIETAQDKTLRGIRTSDSQTLKTLFQQNYPVIKKLVLSNNGNEEDVKDILQQGMIVLYEKSVNPDFILNCTVTTFLYAVCRNILLKKHRQKHITVELKDTHSEQFEVEGDYEQEMVLTNRQQLLYELLEKAGEACKEILKLYYFQKLKLEEIAQRMNYGNAESAKTQKYKCLKKLRIAAKNLDHE